MLYQLSKELDKHVPSFGQHRYVYGAIKGLFQILLDEAQKDNKRRSLHEEYALCSENIVTSPMLVHN